MEYKKHTVHLRIRRFDLIDKPEVIEKTINLPPYCADYLSLKTDLMTLIAPDLHNKVIKIRNAEEILVPISFLTENKEEFFFIDVSNISRVDHNTTHLLQDAYVDAVRQKVKTLESRIAQTELLLPQLEWRRQAYMEETVSNLTNKVAFLNRRFDELYPKFKENKTSAVA